MNKELDFIQWARNSGHGKTQVPMHLLEMILSYQEYVETKFKNLDIRRVMPTLIDCKFKERRGMLKLNLREVAKQTGISAATINRIEAGQMHSRYDIIKKLNDWYASNSV